MNEVSPDIDTGLIDLTGVDLGDLDRLDDSALARSLRRVIRQTEQSEDAIGNFQSSI